MCGEVIGCRFKNPKSYELTMKNEEGKAKMMDGLRIQNNTVTAREINNDEMVVSFINLPTYIDDENYEQITGLGSESGIKDQETDVARNKISES